MKKMMILAACFLICQPLLWSKDKSQRKGKEEPSQQIWQMEMVKDKPRVFVLHNFLSDEECDYLIRYAKPRLERSTVVSDSTTGQVHEARTSYGMFFPYYHNDSTATRIEKRIAQATGIPVENGENIQILNYATGAQYKPHYDYFTPNLPGEGYHYSRGGQRVATVIMYLNTPDEGGETEFPHVKVSVPAIKGDAVLFYNVDESGKEDPLTLHAGTPVKRGEKWIATRWLRQSTFK